MEKLIALTRDRLKELDDRKKQIAFAYSACYRMLPNYKYFYRTYMWGDEYCLAKAIGIFQNSLLTDLKEFDAQELLSTISKNTPDSANFPDPISTYAQNTASAVYYTLNNLFKVDISELLWALILSRDTVDAYIHDEAYKNDEGKFLNNWMMERELEKQEFDFQLLRDALVIDGRILDSLTEFNGGKSNIDFQG